MFLQYLRQLHKSIKQLTSPFLHGVQHICCYLEHIFILLRSGFILCRIVLESVITCQLCSANKYLQRIYGENLIALSSVGVYHHRQYLPAHVVTSRDSRQPFPSDDVSRACQEAGWCRTSPDEILAPVSSSSCLCTIRHSCRHTQNDQGNSGEPAV